MLKKASLLASVLFSLSIMPGLAAAPPAGSDAGATLKRSKENLEYRYLDKTLQEKQDGQQDNVTDKTQQAKDVLGQDDKKITVTKIVTNQSKILTEAEIKAITGKYEGHDLSIKDLYQVVKDINTLYAKKSFITARAYLPPQKIENGIVTIKLVEGRYGKFLLEGNESTRDSFILARMSSQSGDLVNTEYLRNDLLYFNKTNDIQLKAELKPGKEAGTTDCVLRVVEPDNLQMSLFVDNAGRLDTGLFRVGMTMEDNSLFGYRDHLSLVPVWTKGVLSGSAAYSIPVDTAGTRLGLSYDKNETKIVSGPFESLDIEGHSYDFGVNMTRPLNVKPNFKLDGSLEYHRKYSRTDYSGDEILNTKVKTEVLGLTAQKQDKSGVLYIQNTFTRGAVEGADQFFRYNLGIVRQEMETKDRYMLYRFSGQLVGNDHLLPSTEQFTAGGASTVRGYSEGYLSGDEGYFLSAEYNFPLANSSKVRCFVFFDHAGVFPYKGGGQGIDHRDFLYSTGFGAMMNFSKNSMGKLTFGFPIDPVESQSHVRVHVFMQTNF